MKLHNGRRIKASGYLTTAIIMMLILSSNVTAAHQHVEKVSSAPYTYQIKMGGTLDEFNTAEYVEVPLGISPYGNMRLASKFQPNVFLSIENIGDSDVVNPRIVINGRRDWYSAEDILSGILKPGMTEAEKAMAIWSFVTSIEVQCHDNDRRVGNGSLTINKELTNPVKWANSYYCSGCQFAAAVIAILCQKAGFEASATRTAAMGSAHRIAEIYHDGDWHVYDGDERVFHLEDDNVTPASYDDLHDNPDWCDRTHSGGFASRGLGKKRGKYYSNLKNSPKKITEINDAESRLSTMAMTLRPGEKFIWRWDHIGKYRCGDNRRNIKPSRPKGLLPYQLANGKVIYQPRLSGAEYKNGAAEVVNVESVAGQGHCSRLQQQTASEAGYIIYKVSTAYPVVGGRVGAKFFRKTDSDICRVYISVYEPNNWRQVWSAEQRGGFEKQIDIDDALNPLPTPAIYNYYVKFELSANNAPADVSIGQIILETDVQMSGVALPSLSAGMNNVLYRDESKQGRRVRITHSWNESSITVPPAAPAGPVKPAGGGTIDLSLPKKMKLKWQAAEDADGVISYYHIQVSPRSDMLGPVSPNFDRITFLQEPQWRIPKGWLRENQRYYWRVRARDGWGVWSGWSDVWSFTTRGSSN